MKYNYSVQRFAGVDLRLINRNYRNYNAKRYLINNSNQNIWIPNCYLEEDGTIKGSADLSFIFNKPSTKRKIELSKIGNNGGKHSMKNLSVFISLILRHKPEIINIKLDCEGWASVNELITGINELGRNIDITTLEEIVRTDDKNRYSFNQDKTKIRANQGHSVNVKVDLKEIAPPEVLYHGTASRFLNSILEKGILKGSRLYVHLSKDIKTALSVGKRHGSPIILKVNAKDMYSDDHKFYLSENGVWLCDFVPTKYISICVNYDEYPYEPECGIDK